ncbi:MAG TPA: MMPL family transporter [Gammaproteobacteria bacterium]
MTALTDWTSAALMRWVGFVLRFRVPVIVVSLAAAALAMHYASSRLGINTDTANMISPELPWRQDFIEFREAFPARDRNVAVVVSAPSPERADAFASALVARLEAKPELFGSVLAAGIGDFFERNGLLYLSVDQLEALADRLVEAQPLLGLLAPEFDAAAVLDVARRALEEAPDDPAVDALVAELADAVRAAEAGERDPVAWRRLMLGDDVSALAGNGGRRIVVLRPELDFARVQPAAPAMEALRAVLAELAAADFPDVDARVTGSVAMEHEEMLTVKSGAGLAAISSVAMVLLVLYAALRSLKLVAIALVTLIAGLGGTAAFAAAAVGHLNLLSVAFAVLYVGLGVDFIFHVCLRLKELLAEGVPIDDAIVRTAGGVGSSLVICAVTTAAGFYAFIPTDFDGVSELGLISGTGMFISLAVSFTLLPALLGVALSDADRAERRSWLPARSLAPLASRPRAVVGVAVVLGVVAVFLVPRAEFDSNPIHLRDPASESVRTLELLANDGEAPLFDLAAIAPNRHTAEAWAERLRALLEVRRVTTVDALVPKDQQEKLLVLEDLALVMGPGFGDVERKPFDPARLEHALVGLDRTLDGLASSGAGRAALGAAVDALLARLAGDDDAARERRLAALDAAVAADLPAELARLERALEAEPFGVDALPPALAERWIAPDGRYLLEISPTENVNDNGAARRFVAAVRSVVPNATGLPVVYEEASATVVRAFELALIYSVVLVTVLLYVFLRRTRDVLLVLGPLALACAVTAAATVVMGMPFNFANIITLPLLIGIGVDNGIHIVHRMRYDPPTDGTPMRTSTSVAVLACGLTTVASFGNLGFSAHRGMASMGLLLTLGMAAVLAATLVFLPALLRLGGSR